MAQIEYASEDPRIPPKLSLGVLPILKNEVIEIFNKAAGKKFAFRHLPLENFDKALVALAYKGVRRAVPTQHLYAVATVLYHHEPPFIMLLDRRRGQSHLDFHSVTGCNIP